MAVTFYSYQYPGLTLRQQLRRFQFQGGYLTVEDQDGIAFLRTTEYARRATIVELTPSLSLATTCALCAAAFPDDMSLTTHLRTTHGAPPRVPPCRTPGPRLCSAPRSKAAGAAGIEPQAT